jgi:hypothetical protein
MDLQLESIIFSGDHETRINNQLPVVKVIASCGPKDPFLSGCCGRGAQRAQSPAPSAGTAREAAPLFCGSDDEKREPHTTRQRFRDDDKTNQFII